MKMKPVITVTKTIPTGNKGSKKEHEYSAVLPLNLKSGRDEHFDGLFKLMEKAFLIVTEKNRRQVKQLTSEEMSEVDFRTITECVLWKMDVQIRIAAMWEWLQTKTKKRR